MSLYGPPPVPGVGGIEEPAKILFDENFSHHLFKAVANVLAFYKTPPTLTHIFDFAAAGATDDDWVPRAAAEGWTVLTSDRAKQSGGAKLPYLCAKEKATHILISGNLHRTKQFEKARAVISAWPQIAEVSLYPKGSRFSLRYASGERHAVLVEIPNTPRARGSGQALPTP